MNIDVTIIFNDLIITLSSSKPITSDTLISLLRKKKSVQLTGSYLLLDFYTGENITSISESGKMMLMPGIELAKKAIKRIPIEELIQKATQAEKPLVNDQSLEKEYEALISSDHLIEEGDNCIEITLDRSQLKKIMQRFSDFGIDSEVSALVPQGGSLNVDDSETDSSNSHIIDNVFQESITNYLYNAIQSNKQLVRIALTNL